VVLGMFLSVLTKFCSGVGECRVEGSFFHCEKEGFFTQFHEGTKNFVQHFFFSV